MLATLLALATSVHLVCRPRPENALIGDWGEVLRELPNRVGDWMERLQSEGVRGADLYANGERRIRSGHYEDALIRTYRIRELIGQARLKKHGISTEKIDPKLPALKKMMDGGLKLNQNKEGYFTAGRENAALLLIELGDGFGKKLLHEKENSLVHTQKRNKSVLIHGFGSVGIRDEKRLIEDYKEIERLIREDDPENAPKNLEDARALHFGWRLE